MLPRSSQKKPRCILVVEPPVLLESFEVRNPVFFPIFLNGLSDFDWDARAENQTQTMILGGNDCRQ